MASCLNRHENNLWIYLFLLSSSNIIFFIFLITCHDVEFYILDMDCFTY